MKTFTNYAEKKAKQILNLLQGYTKGIRMTAILILLLIGVSNAWAAVNHTGGYVYFLKPSTWSESTVMMWIGHDTYTSVYTMTKVSNTDNLYRYSMPSWGGANYVTFANVGSAWNSGNFGSDSRTSLSHYTNVYNNYSYNSGSFYVHVPASTANNAGLTINYTGTTESSLNLTTRANVYGSTDGGSTYSSMAAAGTVSVSGYYMSNYSTASTRSAVSSTASQAYASTTLAPGSTAKFTATAKTGYEFVGWFSEASGGTAVSTSTTYNYAYGISYTGKTLYARFKATTNEYTVKYGVHSSGNGKIKLNNTSTVLGGGSTSKDFEDGTEVSFTALPNGGYVVEGWYSDEDCTERIESAGTNDSYSFTVTENTEVFVKFTESTHTLTFGRIPAKGGSISATAGGSQIYSPATLDHGTEVQLTATAATGFEFVKWVDGDGEELSTDATYTHALNSNMVINAVYKDLNVLYLKPTDNWKLDGAWFAAYFYNASGNYWASMETDDPCGTNTTYYKVRIPEGDWTHVIFCRMNPDNGSLSWEKKWNQTVDISLPTDGKNLYTITDDKWGQENNPSATGSWSNYTSTYAPIVYNVTVPEGTPSCYICGAWDDWNNFIEMTKVDETHYTIAISDACKSDEYKYCYGPSWGCEEVANTTLPTTTITNRTHKSQDEVKAWVKYCLVGDALGGWSWNSSYSFDIAGDMNHVFDKKDYYIKVMSSTGKYYTHNEYRYNLHRSHTLVKIPYEEGMNNELIFEADMQGNYHFQFNPVNKLFTVVFPADGYQLKITMEDGKEYTSNAVKSSSETLSFFAPGEEDTELSGTVKLYNRGTYVADIAASTFTTSGVYTATLNASNNGITNVALYDGEYYIRTDGAAGGWNDYTNADNKMTYFVPREEEKYSYYWVAALPETRQGDGDNVVNVKACVGNQYNDNLAVMLAADKFTDQYGNVTIKDPDADHREKINVRFGYNPKTNFFERAMLTGSGNMNTFLNITNTEGLVYKSIVDGTLTTPLTTACEDSKFTDVSNWVYEKNVWVNVPDDGSGLSTSDITVRITAEAYNGLTNSLFGFEEDGTTPKERTIIGAGSSAGQKKMRTVYDFKTNRMIMAWEPGDWECPSNQTFEADVLFVRHENEQVPQLNMNGKTMGGIQSQFFALELENKGNANYEEHYWISLPFDCKVGSISGVPGYMSIWGIQRYNGTKRAEIGWYAETATFWEWMEPDDVMEAGVGYVLSFDKKAATWSNFDVHNDDGTTEVKSLLRLYFPSNKVGYTFSTESPNKEYVNEPCTLTLHNRYLQDGNWKIIGPTSYNNAMASPEIKTGDNVWKPDGYTWTKPMFRYAYEYDNSDMNNRTWKYIPEDGEQSTYQSFYGYMVQFAGWIQWSAISQSIEPRQIAARQNTDAVRTKITTRLEIVDGDGNQHDQTFVALDENGTTTFDQNKDLNKIFNNGKVNIYTLSEGIPFAGNTLPMEEVIVPVGVQIATEGEYTFRMPDGTEGMVVELIDYERDITTNLLLFDYTVTLPAGSNESRFALHIQPNKSGVTTGVENVGDKAKGIEKYLIDGKLMIRTAEGVFDAQGKRL